MPAPVTFSLSLAPLPVNANQYTPQQWAQAVIDRLTIAPSAPWSSFQIGTTIPSSDVGPILYGGQQWKVWDSGSGSYIDLVVEGGGLVPRTVQLSAIADGAPGDIFIYDASGHAAALPIGAVGEILTSTGTAPEWATAAPAATSTYFEYGITTDLNVVTNASPTLVPFNALRLNVGAGFDTVNNRLPCPAGSVWFLYADLQLSAINHAAEENVPVSVEIRPNGANGIGAGGLAGYAYILGATGVRTSGVLAFNSAGYADVGVTINSSSPSYSMDVVANQSLTRFGGFRIV